MEFFSKDPAKKLVEVKEELTQRLDDKLNRVWGVYRKINPHRPSSGMETLICLFSSLEDAEAFLELYPDYKYDSNKGNEPVHILQIRQHVIGVLDCFFEDRRTGD